MPTSNLPLAGITVLEFCQYLAGPWAGLRLADLGARVIKIERPGSGEACRALKTKGVAVDGDSLVFHTVNRGKQSYAANLKDPADLERVKQLVARADVMTHNFRPGIMERLGLDHDTARSLNPRLIYGEVTGYGNQGPWRDKPGQDLLAQCLSGITHLTGRADDPPVPLGMATADAVCGGHLAQGILAALIRRKTTGTGARVQVSLLESILDLQFEGLTTWLNDGRRPPTRSAVTAGHPHQGAPYGLYATADGHLALSMAPLEPLADALDLPTLHNFTGPRVAFQHADAIRRIIAEHLATRTTQAWLDRLEPQEVWCAPVLDYHRLRERDGYQTLDIEQTVTRTGADGTPVAVRTLRSPIRLNGQRLFNPNAAPRVGAHTGEIKSEEQNTNATGTPAGDGDTESLGRASLGGDFEPPLAGVTVIDLSQFLSGPSASLRLADLGATVIKIERPGTGDICRQLYVSDADIDGDSTLFHAINRGKLGYAADLKNPADLDKIRALCAQADVVMHNFRPGVIERLGLGHDTLQAQNPDLVYGVITGYGDTGEWAHKPGQDLLAQSLSGNVLLSGNAGDGPVAMGLAVADLWTGALLTQGILAALARPASGAGSSPGARGTRVEVNMLEAMLDFQFEPVTMHLYDGELPERTATNNAHPLVAAPYGIYPTADGHLGLAMGVIPQLGELLGCPPLTAWTDPDQWFPQRDAIKQQIAEHLLTQSTQHWLDILEPADIWCAPVLTWDQLIDHDGFKVLDMLQTVTRGHTQTAYDTTRCPIRLDGQRLKNPLGSCAIGEHNGQVDARYRL